MTFLLLKWNPFLDLKVKLVPSEFRYWSVDPNPSFISTRPAFCVGCIFNLRVRYRNHKQLESWNSQKKGMRSSSQIDGRNKWATVEEISTISITDKVKDCTNHGSCSHHSQYHRNILRFFTIPRTPVVVPVEVWQTCGWRQSFSLQLDL